MITRIKDKLTRMGLLKHPHITMREYGRTFRGGGFTEEQVKLIQDMMGGVARTVAKMGDVTIQGPRLEIRPDDEVKVMLDMGTIERKRKRF